MGPKEWRHFVPPKGIRYSQEIVSFAYFCDYVDWDIENTKHGKAQYMIMELCKSENLSDERRATTQNKFGIQDGAVKGVEMILALQTLHKDGKRMHCDVKANQFVAPTEPLWTNHMKLLDLGESELIESKIKKFKGTTVNASVRVHEQKDYAAVDDIWSTFYSIIDISTNALPWKDGCEERKEDQTEKREYALNEKKKFNQWLENNSNDYQLPLEYKRMGRELMQCNPTEPPYDELISILHEIALNTTYGAVQHLQPDNVLSSYLTLRKIAQNEC
ncbi:MAG: hypothetical protein GY808_04780 [Gammaproteobacteria bacterium]|nr:hypothetical protein [Gammaproteobacteria bacterium]